MNTTPAEWLDVSTLPVEERERLEAETAKKREESLRRLAPKKGKKKR